MSHFTIFGLSVYCHASKDARKNLEPKNELGIFVGYTDTPHNYWLYLPFHKMKIFHRDVNFNEEKEMGCSLEELKLHADEEILSPKE